MLDFYPVNHIYKGYYEFVLAILTRLFGSENKRERTQNVQYNQLLFALKICVCSTTVNIVSQSQTWTPELPKEEVALSDVV